MNLTFEEWLLAFEETLIESGMPPPQARKYEDEYRTDAYDYWELGYTVSQAVEKELLP